jgi:hypothetical protein
MLTEDASVKLETSPVQPASKKSAPLGIFGDLPQRPSSNSAKSKGARELGKKGTHVHGMWYQAAPHERVASENPRFRKDLAGAYLTMTDGVSASPNNVDGHLWTDRRTLRALYMPTGEVEIPHSMIARGPVAIHVKGELGDLIDNEENEATRKTFQKLHNHVAGENIGARSDIERLAYTTLYSSQKTDASSPAEADEINVHMDIDTMDSVNVDRAIVATGGEVGEKSPAPDSLDAAKVRLMAMKHSIETVSLPPVPPPMTDKTLADLAAQPQRSWSARSPAVTATSVSASETQQDASPSRARVQKYQLSTRGSENDVVLGVPGNRVSIRTAQNTIRSLQRVVDRGRWVTSIVSSLRIDAIAHSAALHRLPQRLAELQGGKLRIKRRGLKEIGVTALRDDAAVFQHDDAVGLLYGSEAVRDDQRGAVLRGIVQRQLYQPFTGGIERAGGLVEQQDGRILQDRAGDRDALTLSTG